MELEIVKIERRLIDDSNVIIRTIGSKLSIPQAELVAKVARWKRI